MDSLTDFYNKLNQDNVTSKPIAAPMDDYEWRAKLAKKAHCLKDKCMKHILLDIYCKILPIDQDYIDGHMGQMRGDVDGMLKAKGMSPVGYFKSCYESTKAPLIKFLLEGTDEIVKEYENKETEKKDEAKDAGIDITEPEDIDTDDPDVNSGLVDIESDDDYTNFVDKLKKKTVDKIVNDISELIVGEKEKDDMEYKGTEPTEEVPTEDVPTEEPPTEENIGESTVLMAIDHLNKKYWNENIDSDKLIGAAIRESTLHELDCVFNLRGKSFNEYVSMVNFDKGYVINESVNF